MHKIIPLTLITGTTLLCQAALADPPASTWKGNVELGILITNGNTKTKNITFKSQVIKESDRWRHTLKAEALNSSDKGTTTAERYLASGKSDFKLSDRSYLFGLVAYENDRFSGYNYRVAETLGYGYSLIKRPALTLDLEAGAGARQSRIIITDESRNEAVLHLAGNLGWKISDNATFTQSLSTDIAQKSTITKSVTALTNQIVGNLQSKISFTAQNNSQVPAGTTKLDTETAVTLVYNF